MIGRLIPNPGAIVLPVGILALIVLMVLPIPTMMLDAFFVLNLALSVAILMAALNARQPLDFSAFPSVLLFATLLRLALNVASTRIVLVNGHDGGAAAGQVIESFGAFLVDGNFAVGIFVFIILLIINMIVITKGAGRVSEVSARFTLDALPGKQMAIDADIAAGLMTAEEAKARRVEVTTEADFYGAMDGSSKFVKGDAIAALLILAVNLIAGFCLGMISHGLTAAEAAELYVTLAVGDALVAQVPALLLSIAAAVIVTRVSDKSDLIGQIGGQFSDPKAWLPVAIVLAAIGMIPAMPQTVFLPAAALAFWLCHHLHKQRKALSQSAIAPPAKPGVETIEISDISDHTLVTIELGYGLVHLVDEAKGSPLVARITGVRKQLSKLFGFVVPKFRVRDSLDLAPNDYRVILGGVTVGGNTVQPGKILAIDTGDVVDPEALRGDAVHDPSFGCPALWITPGERDPAIAEGYLTVDPSTVIATHVNQLLSAQGEALLGPEEVRQIIAAVREHDPGLVEAVHPDPLSLAALTRLLRALIADRIALAHPIPIFSAISQALQQTQNFDEMIDLIRADLGGWMVGQICGPSDNLPVITLDSALESAILGGMKDPATGQPLIEPDCARMIGERVATECDKRSNGKGIAMIVQPPARRTITDMLRQRAPSCLVLSITELPAKQPVEVIAVIGNPSPAQDTPQHQLEAPIPEEMAA